MISCSWRLLICDFVETFGLISKLSQTEYSLSPPLSDLSPRSAYDTTETTQAITGEPNALKAESSICQNRTRMSTALHLSQSFRGFNFTKTLIGISAFSAPFIALGVFVGHNVKPQSKREESLNRFVEWRSGGERYMRFGSS